MQLDETHAIVLDQLTITVREGGNATPHLHREHGDGFYVLGEQFVFARTRLTEGSFGFAPPNVVHWFEAPGGRWLNVHAPGRYWAHRIRAGLEGRPVPYDLIDSYDAEGEPDGAIMVSPGEGERLVDDERVLHVKLAQPQLCVFEFDAAPGYVGPSAHYHAEHVDAFYVLEGALEFELDGVTERAEAGECVAAEPRVVHTFKNAGSGRVRFLNFHAPGMRFDEYLRRMDAGEDGREFHESFDVFEVS